MADRSQAVSGEASAGSLAAGNARFYVLALLVLVYMSSYIDRIVIGVVGEAIKKDLKITDTDLGLLTGMSFVLFYGVLGVPVGRLADRYPRKWVLSGCLVLWSLMTTLSGLAGGFGQLLAARIGVGVGEGGCSPSAHSLLADLFPPRQRSLAYAIYGAGPPLGIIVGTLAGGWVAQELGWRAGMIAVGAPGLVLALLILATIREPARGTFDQTVDVATPPPFRLAIRRFVRDPLFVHVTLAMSFAAIGLYSISTFAVPFLMRVYHLPLFQAAGIFGLSYGISGAIGAMAGGAITDWAGTRDHRWYAGVPAIGFFFGGGLLIIALFQTDYRLFIPIFAIAAILVNLALAPAQAVVLGRIEPRMRGSGSAVMLLMTSMIGLGVGPTMTGMLSDRFATGHFAPGRYAVMCPGGKALAGLPAEVQASCASAGAYGLQHALAIALAAYLVAAIIYLFTTRHTAPPIARSLFEKAGSGPLP